MRKVKFLGLFLQAIIALVMVENLQTRIFGQRSGCNETQSTNPFSRNNRNAVTGVSNDAASDAEHKKYVPTQDQAEKLIIYPEGFKPLQIKSKPRAVHTDESRANCITGKVYLRLTFYSNGRIGSIKIIKGLPFGLTKQAIIAAKKLKFDPETRNSKPVSVRKQIEYGFWLY